MATGNITYEQSIGLMTAMTEITRNGAKAARGLVSVQSRYNQIVDESSSTGKKLTAWYKEHNIAIKDQNGQLRSFYEVGGDVAKIWDTLSDNEKRYYLNTQAGANQSQNLAALMKNYGTAIDATNTALNSNNSASKENEKYKKSLKGSLQDLSSAWEDFSRKMVNSKMVTGVLHGLTGVMRGLSSDAGQAAIKFGAVTLAGVGIVKIAPKIFAGFKAIQGLHLVGTFQALGTSSAAFIKAGGEINGVNSKLFRSFTKLTGAAKAFASTTTFAVGLPVALALASVALAKYVKIGSSKEASDIDKNLKKTNKELDKLRGKYKSLYDEREQLRQKKADIGLDKGEETRLKYLEAETKELQRQIELKAQLKAKQTTEAYRKVDPSKLSGSMKERYTSAKASGQSDKSALASAGAYNDLDVAVSKYTDTTLRLAEATDKYNEARKKTNKAEKEYGKDSEQYRKAAEAEMKAFDEQSKFSNKSDKSLNELKKTRDKLYKDYGGKDLFDKNAPQDIKKSERALTKLIKRSEGIKKIQEGTADVGKVFKELGADIGLSGKKLDLKKFQNSLKDVGVGAEDALGYLKQLTKENPDIKINVDGKDTAVKDLKVVDGAIKAVPSEKNSNVKAHTSGQTEVKKLNDTIVNTKGKNVKISATTAGQAGLSALKSAIDKIKSKTVTVTSKKKQEAHGTRNFYARGTENALSGNAIVNEQGFEIIRDGRTGSMRVANAGQRGETWINQGDAVYTHGQSMRMLQKAGLTEADLLQGRSGDVGVFGVRKLEGFKKGKSTTTKKRESFDKELATLEYQRDYYNWTDSQFAAKYKTLYNKYSKYLSTEQKRSYLVDTAEISRGYVQQTIEDTLELFENQQKTYKEMTSIVEKYYKDGKINAEEYADYIKEINKQQVENVKNNYDNQWDYISQYIQRQIDLEEKNNDLLEAQGELLSATTQKVKVYREGVGFVYEADEQAVKEAQENLKSYSSVWEQISEIMDDVESQVNLQRAGVLAGGDLVSAILGAGTDISTWQNIIGLIGSNVGAYGLAGDLGIVDPSKISKATTINGQTFNIDNIALPSVTNANEFVTQLQTLAIQASSSRG